MQIEIPHGKHPGWQGEVQLQCDNLRKWLDEVKLNLTSRQIKQVDQTLRALLAQAFFHGLLKELIGQGPDDKLLARALKQPSKLDKNLSPRKVDAAF